MSTSNRIFFKERIYIPEKIVDMDEIEKRFHRTVYNEEKCLSCEFYEDRHCDVCDECPGFIGTFKMYKEKVSGGKNYIGIPYGARDQIKKVITRSAKGKDLRACPPFKTKGIKFIAKEKPYQRKARKKMIERGYGILKAPPRSGKTVMATSIVCKLQSKTIILASQREWLVGFYETFCGNKSKKIKPFTTIPDLESSNKKIIGFPKTLKEYEKYDICLVTYQSLNSRGGKRLLKKIKDMFGVLVLDECHDAGAPVLARVVNSFNCKYRFGLSGTPERKDKKDFVFESVFGGITYNAKVKTLKPKVTFIETHTKSDKQYSLPIHAVKFLERDKRRTKLIVKHIVSDVKRGHHVVVPVAHVAYMKMLVEEINKKAGKEIAVGFFGGLSKPKKDQIIADAQSGKIKVIVGIRRMVQVGVNIPLWSALYEINPISNPPKMKQETARILTDIPGKLSPVIRHFLDDVGFSRGCLRTCLFKTYFPERFIISEKDRGLALKYTSKATLSHDISSAGIKKF